MVPWRIRVFLAALTLVFLGCAAPVVAQSTPPAEPTAERAQALVNTLQDDAERQRLIDQLQTLIAAQQTAGQPTEELPSTIGSRLLASASRHLDSLRQEFSGAVEVIRKIPDGLIWVRDQALDKTARERWFIFALEIIVILVAGGLASTAANRLLVRPRQAIIERTPETFGMKLPFVLLHMMLRLLPIAAFGAAAYAVLTLSDLPRVRLAVLAIVNASILVRLTMAVCDVLIDPQTPRLRLIAMRDEAATFLHRWIRRFVTVGIYGYFLIEASFVLGLPILAYGVAMQVLGFILTVLAVRLVLRGRVPVADWLRISATPDEAASASVSAIGRRAAAIVSARRWLADIWHIVVSAYIIAVFIVWSLNIYGGFEYLAQATAITIVVAIAARFGANGAVSGVYRITAAQARVTHRLPQLEERIHRYRDPLGHGVKWLVWLAAVFIVLDAWGIDTPGWLESAAGRRFAGSLVTIFVVFAVATVTWEVISVFIEVLLADDNGRVSRSARARTLLPLLRNALLVVLVTFVSLITLSELGVDIAPLLAGAGVVGLAVGFGAQTLVKDLITGLFILLEDTISVGDVVDVGSGHSGVVEAMSVRTIRLRDLAGSVHSVPFSAVTSITNMTKDFSFAVFDIEVAYSEDTEHVIATLRDLGSALQDDPAYGAVILEPLEILGVDQLADSGVIIKARFKTRPIQQWFVGREFKRRVHKRFGELGIEIPFPHMQVVMKQSGPLAPPSAN